jgi:hypothetical protein
MGHKKKSTPFASYRLPTTLLVLVALAVLVGSIYSLVSKSTKDCNHVLHEAHTFFVSKNYQKTYNYLKSQQNACQQSNNTKRTAAILEYNRYLASSAYEVGDNATAKASAKAALNEYSGLPEKEKKQVKDKAIFVDDMFNIMYGVESRELKQSKTK